MLQSRSRLPIAELKDNILHLLEDNNVVVISGETGCGKTTQVSDPFYVALFSNSVMELYIFSADLLLLAGILF